MKHFGPACVDTRDCPEPRAGTHELPMGPLRDLVQVPRASHPPGVPAAPLSLVLPADLLRVH